MRLIGYTMLVSPFVAIFIWSGMNIGWLNTAGIFGGIAAVGIWIGISINYIDN